MSNFDFSPLYRTTIGFDRIADLIDTASKERGNKRLSNFYNRLLKR